MTLPYHLVRREDGQESVTVFHPVRGPITVTDDHPNFNKVAAAVQSRGAVLSDDEIIDLIDLTGAVATKFDKLSERVAVANGRVYFDGDEVHGAITEHIVRFLDEGVDNWRPLVRFLDKLGQNPEQHSREQLYEWLARRRFTITFGGDIVAYKGVAKNAAGEFVSVNHGPAIVDGVSVDGAVPNRVGSTVELARAKVHHDPGVGCSVGLHVGTYEYAKHWAQGGMLEVHVNPRDVVSVPSDCDAAKVRTCRYVVARTIDAPLTAPLSYDDSDPLCDDCGEYEDECSCWDDE